MLMLRLTEKKYVQFMSFFETSALFIELLNVKILQCPR